MNLWRLTNFTYMIQHQCKVILTSCQAWSGIDQIQTKNRMWWVDTENLWHIPSRHSLFGSSIINYGSYLLTLITNLLQYLRSRIWVTLLAFTISSFLISSTDAVDWHPSSNCVLSLDMLSISSLPQRYLKRSQFIKIICHTVISLTF